MPKETLNVGDAVRVYAPNVIDSQLYIIGRVVHIDYEETDEIRIKYGIIYYGKQSDEIATITMPEGVVNLLQNQNPPGCPSHSFTMDYVDKLVRMERQSEGTAIKNMKIGGECALTAIYQDGREEKGWSFEEMEGNTVMLIDSEDNEIFTEEELKELGVEEIHLTDNYTLWNQSEDKDDDVEYRASTDPRMPSRE